MGVGAGTDMKDLLAMHGTRKWCVLTAMGSVIVCGLVGEGWFPSVQGASQPSAIPDSQGQNRDKVTFQTDLDPHLKGLVPRGRYLVVDTAQNRVYLRDGIKTLYEAVASTGSGMALLDPRKPEGGWKFETPRGVFRITHKLKNPFWVKPDWAFIEEGVPIPLKEDDRIESGVLGDYALGFGKGYFIHGTLYTRLLGTNVTHGCIRLGDDELRYVYENVPIGTTIIIF